MSAKAPKDTMGLDRLNALFTWWGDPNSNGSADVGAQMKRFQTLVSDLQKVYGEAYSHQMEAMISANDRITGSLQEFLHCRQLQEVIAAESNFLVILLEEASLQTKAWAEITQKVQDCCAAVARGTAEEIREQAGEGSGATSSRKAAQSHVKDTSKHPAHG